MRGDGVARTVVSQRIQDLPGIYEVRPGPNDLRSASGGVPFGHG